MLSRRYLRIKVFQALYAFFQSGSDDLQKGENELFRSIEQIYDLYIHLIVFLKEFHANLLQMCDATKNKHLKNQEELSFFEKFSQNTVLIKIAENKRISSIADEKTINWKQEQDKEIIKKIITAIKINPEFSEQLKNNNTFQQDKDFIISIYHKHIAEQEILEQFFEEKSIYWANDYYLVSAIIIKLFAKMEETAEEEYFVMPLYKDPEEDTKLVRDLFRKCIINRENNENMISAKAKNWESDRIALIDMILMNMAITELTEFPSIPVKVVLNEYIEISKNYSTRKSKDFINGILDKLTVDLKDKGLIKKSGRGLIE